MAARQSGTTKAGAKAGTTTKSDTKAAKKTTKKIATKAAPRTKAGRNVSSDGDGKAPRSSRRTRRPTARQTIGDYLIQRLHDSGVRDIFGIPGDFVLQFYGMLEESPIRVIGTTREDNAGYAADGYARVHGLGAVCVTYCVGGLSLCNSIAGAYAEKSPVVVISGAPGMRERESNPLLHHRVRDFDTQKQVFDRITVAAAVLDDPLTAFREIDRCLEAAVRYKRPVYLELPRDRVRSEAVHPHVPASPPPKSNPAALREALAEAQDMINSCEKPVIIAGVEMHRFGLQSEVIRLAERNNIPMCATLLGKSVVSEKHPLYLGVYEGAMGRDTVRKFVEESDCVILLGTFMTDINLGIFTARLDPGRCIYVTSEKLRVRHHRFDDIVLSDFVAGLARARLSPPERPLPKDRGGILDHYEQRPDAKLTVRSLFARINALLAEDMVVVADVGDSLFGAADLTIHQKTEFLSPAYYTSMGFAIPAAVGVQVADRRLRPIVLVGDGAFQMTCLELGTALKLGFSPIVIVLNNHGYTTERFLQEGPFNDIPNWHYHRLPELLGGGWGFEVQTERELDQALQAALANEDTFSIVNVHLDPNDISPALQRLAERMSKSL